MKNLGNAFLRTFSPQNKSWTLKDYIPTALFLYCRDSLVSLRIKETGYPHSVCLKSVNDELQKSVLSRPDKSSNVDYYERTAQNLFATEHMIQQQNGHNYVFKG
jgi:hypothetical protein